jgi:glycosyltransferase involved in cell wall biosynthesis
MPKVLFCWSHISGYMAACWRSLASHDGCRMHVIAWRPGKETDFDSTVMQGIPSTLISEEQSADYLYIKNKVLEINPDIIVLCGWLCKSYAKLASDPMFRGKKFVLAMDTPWRGSPRQRVAKYLLRGYLRKMSIVFVPGERARVYAEKLGIRPNRIRRGMYGVDVSQLSNAAQQRGANAWPKRFLFAGRYEHKKGIDVLLKSYQVYRQQVKDPWELVCCGKGPLSHLLSGPAGVIDKGFVQPKELRDVFLGAGALVLPSRYDPWPLIIVEACAAGLPVVATEACGSTVELVRHLYNGLLVTPNDVESLARAIVKLHGMYSDLPLMGQKSRELAAPYSAEMWATRWIEAFESI